MYRKAQAEYREDLCKFLTGDFSQRNKREKIEEESKMKQFPARAVK
jgi:hypothetical protein